MSNYLLPQIEDVKKIKKELQNRKKEVLKIASNECDAKFEEVSQLLENFKKLKSNDGKKHKHIATVLKSANASSLLKAAQKSRNSGDYLRALSQFKDLTDIFSDENLIYDYLNLELA